MVRDQAAVRLAGAGAAHQGAGRRRLATSCVGTAPSPRRSRPSRSSRRAPRSRWTARCRAWSPAATCGSRSPRSTRCSAVREKFEEYGLDARAFAGMKVAAVGDQTAAALRAFGVQPDLVPSGEQSHCRAAGGLARRTTRSFDPIDRVFLPRADIATETLVAGLLELGWEVDDVTAYRTVRAAPPPARDRARRSRPAASTPCCSPRPPPCATSSASPASRTPSTVIACIGPQTAKTAEEHGLRVDVLADQAVGRRRWPRRSPSSARALRLAALEAGESTWRPSPAAGRRPSPGQVGQRTADVPYPAERPRRLRAHARRCAGWSAQTRLAPADLVLPLFVKEGIDRPGADRVDAGVVQHTPRLVAQGGGRGGRGRRRRADAVRHPRRQGRRGSQADAADGVVQLALRDLAAEVGDATVLMADLCLCEYTDHGHCGAADRGRRRRQRRHAGAVRVDRGGAGRGRRARRRAVSGMMDGQVGGDPRRRSTARASRDVAILAYAAKYASAFYGPFREAAESRRRSATGGLPDGPRERRRGVARGRAGRRRGRRHRDGQAGAGLPRRGRAGARRRRRAGRGVPGVAASTRWSRRPRRTAGSTASGRSSRR